MKNIQIRAARIISGAFKSTAETALDVKLHLLFIVNQMDIALYDAMFRIIISSTYFFIKVQKSLFDRQLFFGQTQHQKSLYAQLSPLHKLEIRYAAVFKKDLRRLEMKIPFSMISWTISFKIFIADSAEEAIKIHDEIRVKNSFLIIYTDGSGMKTKMGVSAVTLFIFIEDQTSMMMNNRQAYLDFFIEHTVYSDELIELNLTIDIVDVHSECIIVDIFTDNQAAIKFFKSSKQQFDQHILRALVQRISISGKIFHIH